MDKTTIRMAQRAILMLARLLPARTQLSKPDCDFCEDMAQKLRVYGANAQVTERQLRRLQQCSVALMTSSGESCGPKAG